MRATWAWGSERRGCDTWKGTDEVREGHEEGRRGMSSLGSSHLLGPQFPYLLHTYYLGTPSRPGLCELGLSRGGVLVGLTGTSLCSPQS